VASNYPHGSPTSPHAGGKPYLGSAIGAGTGSGAASRLPQGSPTSPHAGGKPYLASISGAGLGSGTGAAVAPTASTARKTVASTFMAGRDSDGCSFDFDVGGDCFFKT